MSELQVEIVRLDPMRVASFYGFGPAPEAAAAGKLLAWAELRGLWEGGVTRRVFGFNNPAPSAGSPNYGYEFWLELKPGDAPDSAREGAGEGEMEIKTFPGGLYAVTHCRGVEAVPDTWRALVTWLEDSRYAMSHDQCLEQHTGALDGDPAVLEFALYQAVVA